MKKTTLALAAILGLVTVSSRATTLDFEDLSGAGDLVGSYHGLTFANWHFYDSPQDPYNASSGVERIYNDYNASDPADYVGTIKFGGAVTFNSLWMAGYSLDQWVEGYSGGVKIFESAHTPYTDFEPMGATVTLNWAGVDEIRVQSTGAYGIHDYYVIDDVTYNRQSSVPDSGSTLALLGSVLAGFATLRRRLS